MPAVSHRRAALRAAVSLFALSAPLPAWAEDSASDLPDVVISTNREAADGPVQGYRAKRSASATKTDTALIDTPQTVTVVPRAILEDTNASTADKALEYVPGTAKGNTFGGLNTYDSIMRGFRTSVSARNGFTAGRRYDSSTDSANVERVEVLMGPSAQIYGRSDPGGMYNIITKKPLTESFTEIKGEFGSFNAYRGTADVNIAPEGDKSILGRVNLAIEDKDSFREHVSSHRRLLAPTVSWQGSGDTRAVFDLEYLHDERTFDRGVVAVNGDVKALPINRYLGDTNDGRIAMDNLMGALRIEHDINADWTLRTLVMAKNGSLWGYSTDAVSLNSTTGILTRRTNLRDYYWSAGAAQIETVGHFAAFGLNHTLLSGVEVELSQSTERRDYANAASINIWAPVYGTARPALTNRSDLYDSTNKYALYAQDQIELTQALQLQLGLRWDSYDQHSEQRNKALAPFGPQMNQSRGAVSPRAGLLYKITPTISTYANISKSFNKNPDVPATDRAGMMIEPEKSLGTEAGIKADLLDDTLSVNAAVYRIVKHNASVTDPDDSNYARTSGKVRSRGFDLSITGNITPEWRLIGGYAYVDAEILQDPLLPRGSNLQNIPMHSVPLMSVYEFQKGELSGLGLGGGVTYVGKRAVADGSNVYMPEYAKVDLLAYYKLDERVKFNFNIYNLLDKGYYSSALGTTRVMPGESFTALGSVSVKF